jgi:hypothetical protein
MTRVGFDLAVSVLEQWRTLRYSECAATASHMNMLSNPILIAFCTSTFSKLCKQRILWHIEKC